MGETSLLGDLDNKPIGKDEIEEALGNLKVGKALGLDGIALEILKYGGEGGRGNGSVVEEC